MPYDVDVQIAINAKGFQPMKATLKPKNVDTINSTVFSFKRGQSKQNLTFKLPSGNEEAGNWYCMAFDLGSVSNISFLAIRAKSYRRKPCDDPYSIGFALCTSPDSPAPANATQSQDASGCCTVNDVHWIDGDYIAFDFCDANEAKQYVRIYVHTDLVDCDPNTPFDVNLTYGLKSTASADNPMCCGQN